MSNFPMWWDTTITVYNKYTDPQTRVVKWFKHTIPNCFWKSVGSKMSIGETILDTQSIVVRIPQQKDFLEKYEWLQTPNDQMGNYFTLGQGDVIIKGKSDEDIDEYVNGKRSTDIIAKYRQLQGCVEIKDVAIDTQTGMIAPHYCVRGL